MNFNRSLIAVLAASLLAVSCFAADDPNDPGDPSIIFWKKDKDKDQDKDKKSPKKMVSSSVKASETPIPRIWIGLTGSITPLKLLHTDSSGNLQDSYGDSLSATNAGGFAGGGVTVNARILKNYWLSVGAIYRYTGYNWSLITTDVNGDAFVERARIRLIDFPVMIKYTGRKFNPLHKYAFYELGGAFRDVMSHTITTNQSEYGSSSVGLGVYSGTAYHRQDKGAMAGVGIIAKDDFGIIVSPEVRYTRWFGDTFGSQVIGTQKNQLEITVSFGF